MSQTTETTRRPATGNLGGGRLPLIIAAVVGLVVILVVALLVAWGGRTVAPLQPSVAQEQTAPQSQPQPSGVEAPASRQGNTAKTQPAPDFSVPTLDGKTFRLSQQKGKVTVVFFMAYWCGTCVPEARALGRLYQEYGADRLSIVAVDVDPNSTPESLRVFADMAGNPGYTWAFDTGNQVLQAYQVRSLDTTVIVNPAGEMVYRDGSPTSYNTLKKELEKLLS